MRRRWHLVKDTINDVDQLWPHLRQRQNKVKMGLTPKMTPRHLKSGLYTIAW